MTIFGSDLILARLRGLHPKVIDLSLDRIRRILVALGHPERRLAPTIHIAGTNGKGSTLAFLDAMLHAAGFRTQRYVSPHLVHFNERMLFDGVPIAEPELATALDVAERVNGGLPITEFEITTAAAFHAFAARPADYLLMETGLGGRLDATNVVDRPRLTALSPIDLDHQGFLGERLEQIAFEKAGILKPGVPCIVGPQHPAAARVIAERAAEVAAPLVLHGRDWTVEAAEGGLRVTAAGGAWELPLPVLAGRHQITNAGLAVMLALHLEEAALGRDALARGLESARWPGRLQRLRSGPLLDGVPPTLELWLDGGHNPSAAEALAASLADDPRPLHLIVGMLRTKDASCFLRPLSRIARSLVAVPVPDEPASRPPEEIAAAARPLGIEAGTAAGVREALLRVAAEDGAARVLICGSLYLAGHVLRENAEAIAEREVA